MKISHFIPLFLLLLHLNAAGLNNSAYDRNLNITIAHQYLFAFRTVSCEKLLDAEEIKNPGNGYVTFYRLYREIIGLTISNSEEEYQKKYPLLRGYVDKLEKLPDNAAEYRMLLGEAKVFTGLMRVKYDSKLSGLIECLKGYRLLEKNEEKYPLFEPDCKIQGMVQIGVAFMPGILQWGIKLLGIKSDPQGGLKKLSDFTKFAKGKPGYEEEAFLFTIAACKLMNQDEEVMKLIHQNQEHFKEMALLNYMAATICLEANDAETALQLLSGIVPEKLELSFPPLHYLTGKAKMMRLDDDAYIPFLNYLAAPPGTDYLKATLYELACYYYISRKHIEYQNYMEQVKVKGRELHNRDIEAAFEAQKTEQPNILLMKADFLVRGGYFARAEDELKKVTGINSLAESVRVHYYYLTGECNRLKNHIKEAESAYLMAAAIGKISDDYMAQKALVQAGLMMEKNALKTEAEKYYRLCLDFKTKNNPYTGLYRNKAKAGLIRCSFPE